MFIYIFIFRIENTSQTLNAIVYVSEISKHQRLHRFLKLFVFKEKLQIVNQND